MAPEADWVFGGFRLDPAERQLWRGATAVPLRPKLFAALHYLVEHAGRLITREELLRAVWSRTHVDETLLRGTMRDLRAALEDDADAPRFIETIPHQGYRFLVAVRREVTQRAEGDAPPSAATRTHGLIERERERAQLDRCLERTLKRQRQMVFVTGEPGIGKTTLVDAFVDTLPLRHGVLVGRGQCVEQYGGSEAYLPVLEAIGQLCRQRAGKRVLAILNQYAPTWLVQLPALLTDAEHASLQRKTQGAARERMLREMAEALEALSVETPVALVFEDLHWSDHSTLDLLAVLARRRESARLLILGTYRPADLILSGHPLRALTQELLGRGSCEEVALRFLSESAIGTYLVDRFGAAPEDSAFRSIAQLMHRRTDGNPLFMVNVADDLVARGVIAIRDGAWRVDSSDEQTEASVPDGLKPLIDRQLERLQPEDQRLLEAASVVGRVFSAAAVAAALETAPERIDERCEEVSRRAGFIAPVSEPDDGYYRFLHDLYQRALYDRLSTARRARLHRRVAELEAKAPADQVRQRAAQLAIHFERGGDHATAVAHLQQAATNALRRQALQEAIAALQHALSLLEPLPPSEPRDQGELSVQLSLSAAFAMAKGPGTPAVGAVLTRARELSRRMVQSPTLLPVLLGMARLHCMRGELHAAAALGDEARALARHAPDPLPLMTDSVLMYVQFWQGELAAASQSAQRSVAAYDSARHGSIAFSFGEDPGVWCLGYDAWACWGLGYPERAEARASAAIELARRLEIPHCEAAARYVSSGLGLMARDLPAAAANLDTLEAVAASHGFGMYSFAALGMRGWLLQEQGAYAAAIEALEKMLAMAAGFGAQLGMPWFMANLAQALAASGQAARAHAVIEEAIAMVKSFGERQGWMRALTVKGDLCAAAGNDIEAAACFDEAIALARECSAKMFELRASTRLARVRQREGKAGEARALLGGVYAWFTEGFDAADLRDARALLASLDEPPSRLRARGRRTKQATR